MFILKELYLLIYHIILLELVSMFKFEPSPFIAFALFFGIFLVLSTYSSLNLTLSLFSEIFAQPDVQVVKYRNLTLDVGDGVTTKAQLSYPAIGKGPFPVSFSSPVQALLI